MPLHLVKLCVGVGSLAELAALQAARLATARREGRAPELFHITRNMPKRVDEILPAGSMYWVMNGWITARQRLIEFRRVEKAGIAHCALIFDAALVAVEPCARRPFQGWRYLRDEDAPPDRGGVSGGEDLPDKIRRELIALGLL